MRTTLDIPEALITRALKITQIKTKTSLISTALQELIRKHTIAKIKNYKGKIDLDMDLDSIRERK